MWLLNAKTLEVEEFFDSNLPQYAILSHRWQADELTFKETKPKYRARLNDKQGFVKVRSFCQRVLQDDYLYCWVDTCCIKQESSSAVSEAINSMYQWYATASVCYVYLADVPAGPINAQKLGAFRSSECFVPPLIDTLCGWQRGWTLQELLAPPVLVFLDTEWIPFGSKLTFADEISKITTIEARFLVVRDELHGGIVPFKPESASVAQKMSWISSRKTSRKEDIAYCLLGLFDLNMPLLYGEGDKAFLRLQQEIIRTSDDETIFAWRTNYEKNTGSILAKSPTAFSICHNIYPLKGSYNMISGAHSFFSQARPPYHLTNKGLQIQSGILVEVLRRGEIFARHLLPLNCICTSIRQRHFLAIILDSRWSVRRDLDSLYVCEELAPSNEVFGIQKNQQSNNFGKKQYSARLLEDAVNRGNSIQAMIRYRWHDSGKGEQDSALKQLYLSAARENPVNMSLSVLTRQSSRLTASTSGFTESSSSRNGAN